MHVRKVLMLRVRVRVSGRERKHSQKDLDSLTLFKGCDPFLITQSHDYACPQAGGMQHSVAHVHVLTERKAVVGNSHH